MLRTALFKNTFSPSTRVRVREEYFAKFESFSTSRIETAGSVPPPPQNYTCNRSTTEERQTAQTVQPKTLKEKNRSSFCDKNFE